MLRDIAPLRGRWSRSAVERSVMLGGSVLVALAYATSVGGVLQAAAAALFFAVCPGLAIVAPARLRLEVELAVVVPVSLAVTVLVSLSLLFATVWTPGLALAVLIGLVCVGAFVTRAPAGRPAEAG